MGRLRVLAFVAFAYLGLGGAAQAQVAAVESLARKHANPVSSIISVPFQFNFDCCLGETDADLYTLKFQPVYPFNLNANWRLVTRTVMPVIYREALMVGGDAAFGLNDTLQHFLISPRHPYSGHTIGFGPVISWPTGTNSLIDSGKWSAGPSFALFRQHGSWTYGTLAHHIWSFANASSHPMPRVNESEFQPTLAYTWKNGTSLTLNSESRYEWDTGRWQVPINLVLSRIYHFGEQPVSFGIGGRVYAVTPPGGPDWGLRAQMTFLFDTEQKR